MCKFCSNSCFLIKIQIMYCRHTKNSSCTGIVLEISCQNKLCPFLLLSVPTHWSLKLHLRLVCEPDLLSVYSSPALNNSISSSSWSPDMTLAPPSGGGSQAPPREGATVQFFKGFKPSFLSRKCERRDSRSPWCKKR